MHDYPPVYWKNETCCFGFCQRWTYIPSISSTLLACSLEIEAKKDISMLKTVAVLLLVIYHENRKIRRISANALALGLAPD